MKALLNKMNSDDQYPLLYLVDEIFRGTNNQERLIGSQAYIQNLVGKNGVGVIATHDLELIKQLPYRHMELSGGSMRTNHENS